MDEHEVFICYSHKDTIWKENINRFMQAMQRAKEFGFSYWDDSQIASGEEWENKISSTLGKAKAGLLLVSADFLASDFIQDKEIPQMLKRTQEDNSDFRIFPLLVRPCPWEAHEWLRKLQLVNEATEPLSGCTTHRCEEIFTSLMWEISQHIEKTNEAEKTLDTAEEDPEPPKPKNSKILTETRAALPKSSDFERPERDGAYQEKGKYNTFLTNAGVVNLIETARLNLRRESVVGLLCIFRTLRQRTWFAVTDGHFYCVLDDEKTAAGRRHIQWEIPLGEARPVLVRKRSNKATGLIGVGNHPNWLYTQRFHPDSECLKKAVEKMIEVAERS